MSEVRLLGAVLVLAVRGLGVLVRERVMFVLVAAGLALAILELRARFSVLVGPLDDLLLVRLFVEAALLVAVFAVGLAGGEAIDQRGGLELFVVDADAPTVIGSFGSAIGFDAFLAPSSPRRRV